MTEIFKKYIAFSNDFRKSNASKQSIENLYDLLYELAQKERNKEENFILCNVYFLLEYYQSAYEIFEKIADKSNPKEMSKLYVWQEKALSHKNNFIIKDVRKLKIKNEQPKFELADFQKNEKGFYQLKSKKVVVFNQFVDSEDFHIQMSEKLKLADFFDEILEVLQWLCDAKTDLVKFYNKTLSSFSQEKANDHWYSTLEVYSVGLLVGENGKIYSEISVGDEFSPDHIIDIETENQQIINMSIDG